MPAHMLLRIFRLTRAWLMNPYTIHAFFFVLWLAMLRYCYLNQSGIGLLVLCWSFHTLTVVNHRMCEAGYYGSNPFKAPDRSDDK